MSIPEAPAPAYFFSDVHLGFDAPETERAKQARLLRFLGMVRAAGRSLFCLGDLFDFWFEYETTIPRRYFAVLRRLQELSESGIKLYFIGGNHDYWVRRNRRPGFLEQEIGFELLRDGAEVQVEGLRLLLVHGDGLGSRDVGYRLLKRVLRNRLAIEAFRWVHPDLARRIGLLTSRMSRHGNHGEPREEICARVRDYAAGILRARPDLDAVIAGHSHQPEEMFVGRGRYLNLGDWIHHASYARIENGSLTLHRFEPRETAPPVRLAEATEPSPSRPHPGAV